MAACAAARVGAISARLPGIPFSIKLLVTGTAEAEVPEATFQALAEGKSRDSAVPMSWTRGGFVGEHWLLGRIRISFDPTRNSTGSFSGFQRAGDKASATHRNEFFFNFQFSRMPNSTFSTDLPIVNEAKVEEIPPIGSVYNLVDGGKILDITNKDKKFINNVGFDFCKITIIPERNIAIRVVKVERVDSRAIVVVELKNLTSSAVRATYFVVDHEPDLSPVGDADFFRIGPSSTVTKTFEVHGVQQGKTYVLPLYAGLYRPEDLQGSAVIDLNI